MEIVCAYSRTFALLSLLLLILFQILIFFLLLIVVIFFILVTCAFTCRIQVCANFTSKMVNKASPCASTKLKASFYALAAGRNKIWPLDMLFLRTGSCQEPD